MDVAHSPASRAFFHLIGSSLRGEATTTQGAVMTKTLAPTLALAACGHKDAEGNATAPESVVVDDANATDLDSAASLRNT
jgi:hypothetical protein